MNRLVKLLFALYLLPISNLAMLSHEAPSKSFLQALLSDDYESLVRCFHEDRMRLRPSDVCTWATHYYSTRYSHTKHKIAQLVLLGATYYKNVPSLKELVAQKVAQLRAQNSVSIKMLPVELAVIVHNCPAYSLKGLQKYCASFSETEKFILMNQKWSAWDVDMHESKMLMKGVMELNKFISEREQTICDIAQIFFNTRYQDSVPLSTHTKSLTHCAHRKDVDTILTGIISKTYMYDAVISRLQNLIPDAVFQQEEWIDLIKINPENEREIEFEQQEKAKCCILQ